jgi:hypothetical protein
MAYRKINVNFQLWSRYLRLLNERPLLTKCVTGGGLAMAADIVCQFGEQQGEEGQKFSENFDPVRCARFTSLGAFLVSPTLHYWYGYLGRAVPGTTSTDAMKRLFFDQVIFAPLFIPTFFFGNLLLEGKLEEFMDKVKRDLFSTVVTNYIVWIPAQFVNFRYISPNLQVLFSNTVGFFWNIFMSYMTNRDISDTNTEGVDLDGAITSKEQEEKISDFISAVSSGIISLDVDATSGGISGHTNNSVSSLGAAATDIRTEGNVLDASNAVSETGEQNSEVESSFRKQSGDTELAGTSDPTNPESSMVAGDHADEHAEVNTERYNIVTIITVETKQDELDVSSMEISTVGENVVEHVSILSKDSGSEEDVTKDSNEMDMKGSGNQE